MTSTTCNFRHKALIRGSRSPQFLRHLGNCLANRVVKRKLWHCHDHRNAHINSLWRAGLINRGIIEGQSQTEHGILCPICGANPPNATFGVWGCSVCRYVFIIPLAPFFLLHGHRVSNHAAGWSPSMSSQSQSMHVTPSIFLS